MRKLAKKMTKRQRLGMSMNAFCEDAQNQMIDRFVQFCHQTDTPPTLANSNQLFGICDRDSKPIVASTIQILAEAEHEAFAELGIQLSH